MQSVICDYFRSCILIYLGQVINITVTLLTNVCLGVFVGVGRGFTFKEMALLQPVFDFVLFSVFSENKWMYWTHMKASTFVVIKILKVGCHYEIRFSADIICDNSFHQHCTKDIQGSTPEQYLKLLARNNINQCHLMMAGEPSNWKLMKFKVKDNRLKKLSQMPYSTNTEPYQDLS